VYELPLPAATINLLTKLGVVTPFTVLPSHIAQFGCSASAAAKVPLQRIIPPLGVIPRPANSIAVNLPTCGSYSKKSFVLLILGEVVIPESDIKTG
jgi:hypothetical protein